MNKGLYLLVLVVVVVMLVPYILCLAGSRLHNRPLCTRSGLSVFPASWPSLLVDLVSFALFVLARPRSCAIICLNYGLWLTSFALGGFAIEGLCCGWLHIGMRGLG